MSSTRSCDELLSMSSAEIAATMQPPADNTIYSTLVKPRVRLVLIQQVRVGARHKGEWQKKWLPPVSHFDHIILYDWAWPGEAISPIGRD